MQWTCKLCSYGCEVRGQLLKHYRLKHANYTRRFPIPCLYKECLCTFQSFNALKVHLSRLHSLSCNATKKMFHCQLCKFHIYVLTFGCTKRCSALMRTVNFKAVCIPHLMHTEVKSTMADIFTAKCISNLKL